MLPLELLPEIELEPEPEEEEVGVAKVFEGEDAGDAPEELIVAVSLEVEFDTEEVLSVLVGLKTPLYVVEIEEDEDT